MWGRVCGVDEQHAACQAVSVQHPLVLPALQKPATASHYGDPQAALLKHLLQDAVRRCRAWGKESVGSHESGCPAPAWHGVRHAASHQPPRQGHMSCRTACMSGSGSLPAQRPIACRLILVVLSSTVDLIRSGQSQMNIQQLCLSRRGSIMPSRSLMLAKTVFQSRPIPTIQSKRSPMPICKAETLSESSFSTWPKSRCVCFKALGALMKRCSRFAAPSGAAALSPGWVSSAKCLL